MKYGFIFICLIGLFTNVGLSATENYAISQGAPVALHEKPIAKSAITALLDPGMSVNINDAKEQQGFVLVSTKNKEFGWIAEKRLTPKLHDQVTSDSKSATMSSVFQRIKSTLGFSEPTALTKAPTLPTGKRDQILNQYSQLQGAYLQLQHQRQQNTLILGVIALLIGVAIGLWINKYRYNRNRW